MNQTNFDIFFAGWHRSFNGEYVEAGKIFRKISESIPAAKTWMALNYLLGLGTRQNRPRAHSLFLEAAKNGSISALFCLGDVYLKGTGVEKNTERALDYWRRAAAAKVESRRRNTETCRDGNELIAFLENEAADMAAENLSKLYETGMHGVRKNSGYAKRWSERAQGVKRLGMSKKRLIFHPPIESNHIAALPQIHSAHSIYTNMAREAESRHDFECAAKFYLHAINGMDYGARESYLGLRNSGKLDTVLRAWQRRQAIGDTGAKKLLAMVRSLGLVPIPIADIDGE